MAKKWPRTKCLRRKSKATSKPPPILQEEPRLPGRPGFFLFRAMRFSLGKTSDSLHTLGMIQRAPTALIFLACSTALSGCASTYYNALENVGIEKRDILVRRVDAARDAQSGAQEEFQDALEQYRTLVNFDGGELAVTYDRLSKQYTKLEGEAKLVRARIESIENVGGALFREWRQELNDYTSPELRRRSEEQLRDTESRYDLVVTAMHAAADRMDPVLEIFEDQVLFLKHNLNAKAIAGLDAELAQIETRVEALIKEMDKAIAEAESFIAAMPPSR